MIELCGTCNQRPRYLRGFQCRECVADRAAKSARSRRLSGKFDDGWHDMYRLRRPADVVTCIQCGAVVTWAHATMHAYREHGRRIPIEFASKYFKAVA